MSGQDVNRAVGPLALAGRVRALVPGTYRRLSKLAAISFVGGALEAALLVWVAQIGVAVTEEPPRVELPLLDSTLSIGVALGMASALLVVRLVAGVLIAYGTAGMAAAALTDARLQLLRSFLGASWPVKATERQGDLQELMTTHAERTSGVTVAMARFVTSALNVCTLVAIALVVDPLAALAIVVTGGALAFGFRPLASAGRRNADRLAWASRNFASGVSQLVSTSREVEVFGVADPALAEIEELHDQQARRYRRSRFMLLLTPQVYQSSALMVLIAGIGVVSLTTSDIASIGAVVLLLLRAFSYGQQAQTGFQALNDASPYIDNLRRQRDKYRDGRVRGGDRYVPRVGRVELDGIGYEYQPGRPVLHGVSGSIEPGEAIGIIGPSGSGKSTLLQVLLRLRSPTTGRLVADGRDLRDLELPSWYERVAFVPQDPHLVVGTVAENIAFYRDISMETIREVAAMAHLADEIDALPGGYDEVIGPEDTTLSGGQQQRLAIARALAGRPELLVLDEPTSALDMVSEARIQETLRTLHGQMSLVVVAHRMSTIGVCDRIMVLIDGLVQGFAPHDELLATSTFYEETLRLSLTHTSSSSAASGSAGGSAPTRPRATTTSTSTAPAPGAT